MKISAEKVGQLLNYEKISNVHLLDLPKIEKKDIPSFINCPKYEKAKNSIEQKMKTYQSKIDRCNEALQESDRNISDMRRQRDRLDPGRGFFVDTSDAQAVAKYNDRLGQTRKMNDKIEYAIGKHNELVDKRDEAIEEAKEKLQELNLEALLVIDEDIAVALDRCTNIVEKLTGSQNIEDLVAAIDICLIELRIYAMFEDHIEDNNARKDCREHIAKANQMIASLCANENVQSYLVDLYKRNLDLVQTNTEISQQIAEVLSAVDQGQLDTFTQSINAVLAEKFDTDFSYKYIIDPAEIDAIIVKIKKTIDALNQNIAKAKETSTVAVDFAKIGVNTNQQAEALRTSMHSNVEAFEEPLMKSHIAIQMIEDAVIESFYQKDLRVAATALRKHLVDTLGEKSFGDILKGGDDLFSLKKAQEAINKANLVRLQAALDKVPDYVKKLTELISNAESDIQKANEVPKQNAEALNAELSKKYINACFPVFGFISAFGILGRLKAFESAFCSTNQIYRDLGNTLLEKNKKMITVIMIIGAILGFGGMAAFFVLNLGDGIAVNAGVPGAILLFYIITIFGLTSVGKRLSSYLSISAGK